MGNGQDQAAGHLGAQGDKLLTVAERNIRSFLRSATFKSESDREVALNCVDVLWEAARAPADSVLEDADPLQGAANWLAQAHGQFCVAVLQGCLMIGYNRAKRLHDASIAARKQGGA